MNILKTKYYNTTTNTKNSLKYLWKFKKLHNSNKINKF